MFLGAKSRQSLLILENTLNFFKMEAILKFVLNGLF